MTQYGTIPTSSSLEAGGGSSSKEYITKAKERIKEGLGNRRPWKIMFNFRSLSTPPNLAGAVARLRTNVAYFRMNYTMIALAIVFLSLLWHPISLIVFIAMMAAWLFLYFLRDEPLVIYGRLIGDRVVLFVLGILTVVFLLLTQATLNVMISLLIGVGVVAVHGVVRKTDDLFLDEESTGLMTPPAAAAAGGSSSS